MKEEHKRKYSRKHALIMLTVDRPDIFSDSARAALVDISAGGAAFESIDEFKVGEQVLIRIVRSEDDVFVLAGTVKRISSRSGSHLYGIEFPKMSSAQRKRLCEFIEEITGHGCEG